ncbi:MAG TPA: ribokinase [Roseiarcus sp.]|nr:ribokinase [Roseiarcus sp.]
MRADVSAGGPARGRTIHVIGNATLDSVIRVERLPRPGETIVALGASEDLGGKGANQAIVAARCGAPVRLVAAIGDDAAGERTRFSLAREGVQTDGVTASPFGTDRCVITVDGHGENTILSLIDAARHFDPIAETRIESWIRPGDSVVMQGNLRADVTCDCLALAKSKGATTILNPSPTYGAHDYDWSLVDLVLVNRGEAIELAGVEPEAAPRELCDKGAGAVILTLGAEGARFVSADEAFRVAAPRVAAVDAVGAGDVFCGVLVAARARGRSWGDALGAAVEAASISVTRTGVLASFPSRQELAAILQRGAVRPLEEHQQ